MRLSSPRSFALLCLLGMAVALPAQFATLAYETFNYPNQTMLGGLGGGAGWQNNWWSGGCACDASVLVPGLDGMGGMVKPNYADAGSYRIVDNWAWGALTNANGKFGKDGTTIWVSFDTMRVPGTTDQYGGVSLFEQWVGEKLFLGSPWQSNGWGFHGTGSTPNSVPVASLEVAVHLVYRIDYLAGQERLRMWINPATAHPQLATPALDVFIPDAPFNEIRIQAGSPATPGASGWYFDNLHIEATFGALSASSVEISTATGGTQTMLLDFGTGAAGRVFLIAGTVSGTLPGIPVGAFTIPLNYDFWTDFTLANPNSGFTFGLQGFLDANGQASALLNLPPVVLAGLIGLEVNHAAVAFDTTGALTNVSNALPCTLVP